jgi:hypothetical protein
MWNFASVEREDAFTISGTKGRLSFSLFGDEPLRLETPAGLQMLAQLNPTHVQQPLIQKALDDLFGRSPSTGETARRTSDIMDPVLAGYYGGRTDEFWRRPDGWPGRRQLVHQGS